MASQTPDLVRSPDVLRDNDYYYPAGDTIIQVENTLFKIHKFLLAHHSPVFATMFALPVESDPEGAVDDLPIVLEGETAANFRAVVKYIYAPPIQLQIQFMRMTDVPEMISVAKFSHKYAMDHWKQWALRVLASRKLTDMKTMPTEHLAPLYSLFDLLEVHPERTQVMNRWCEVIEQNNFPIGPALAASETSGDRDALVAVYCIQIRRWEKDASISGLPDGVSSTHFQRMLTGYTSLTLAWNQLRTREPSANFQDTQCNGGETAEAHAERCLPYSRQHWGDAIMSAEDVYPHITHLPSRLSHVAEHIRVHNRALHAKIKPTTATCFDAVIKRFAYHLQRTDTSLTNHFFRMCEALGPAAD
ncbi:BTB domain-containing protein [Mycena sanguinolenta]|uniref:BTB domain-containing protein n=1 Tax=Mycena sanguinolenta TaxID=230812 RepID=A0A8H6U0V1_9AGAR|nr:BTB domain-containing protein [Mycena sanguinolenta]KAF7336516.1 BTB domain-containing protein [Mycena sanguinolenta]